MVSPASFVSYKSLFLLSMKLLLYIQLLLPREYIQLPLVETHFGPYFWLYEDGHVEPSCHPQDLGGEYVAESCHCILACYGEHYVSLRCPDLHLLVK